MTYLTTTQTVYPAAHEDFSTSSIFARLDDWGLTPNQFRVYCRLLRCAVNGVVSQSSESIAKACKLTRITVIRVLAQLVDMGMLQCDRTSGKKSVFYLLPISSWRMASNGQNKQITEHLAKVVQLKVSTCEPSLDTCKPNIQVKEINTQEQESQEPPLGGVPVDSTATELHSESNLFNSDTGSLDEKLAKARARGWWDSGTWWDNCGQQVVKVNGLIVSVQEFMHSSLESFASCLEPCPEGRAMIAAFITTLKQKKKACAS